MPWVGTRESAQITLVGLARLVSCRPRAPAAALTLWALRRAGLTPLEAARTLLVFSVVLYSVFLITVVVSGRC